MVNAILQAPELGQFDTSSIRFITGGGEKMPVTLIEHLLAAFPKARFADAYGLTETVSGDTFNDQAHTLSKIGSVGKPVLNLDVKILGPGDLPAETSEILLRGPKVVAGYWNNPEATAAAFTQDGWFRTGDIGHLDSGGYLYIDDRKKDMIVSGGENVATSEIERVLYEHDVVLEAAVIGMPDARWGEVPRAFVVLRQNMTITSEQLITHCRARLAGFKTPKEIVFLDALPTDSMLEAYRRMAPGRSSWRRRRTGGTGTTKATLSGTGPRTSWRSGSAATRSRSCGRGCLNATSRPPSSTRSMPGYAPGSRPPGRRRGRTRRYCAPPCTRRGRR
jgi:acyl-CoA synthetase (AMP-forming)/AMP-acid ligase II